MVVLLPDLGAQATKLLAALSFTQDPSQVACLESAKQVSAVFTMVLI